MIDICNTTVKKNSQSAQTCSYISNGEIKSIELPPAEEYVFRNIKWGEYDRMFTPAFWKVQILMCDSIYNNIQYKIGSNLYEEIAGCILGGYGITAEMGLAAFQTLKDADILHSGISKESNLYEKIYELLSNPVYINGKPIHYRFARQRSERLYSALMKIENETPPEKDIDFRNWLLKFNGIGPKTASWITRNWLGSNNVAIIDIHIFRAATIMGLFQGNEKIDKEYFKLEELFLSLAQAMNVCAAKIDVIIWSQMRSLSNYSLEKFRKAQSVA